LVRTREVVAVRYVSTRMRDGRATGGSVPRHHPPWQGEQEAQRPTANPSRMTGKRTVVGAVVALCSTLLLIGTLAAPSHAQEPSDPGTCTERCAPTEVLSGELSRPPGVGGGGSGSLAKTGLDVLVLVLAAAAAITAGVAVRRAAAERT
jgi:hypothetical protein